MSKVRRTAEDWLEWAQAKHEAAQERYAFGGRPDTMDSYSTLVNVIEQSMASAPRAKMVDDDGEWFVCSRCKKLMRIEIVDKDVCYCPSCGSYFGCRGERPAGFSTRAGRSTMTRRRSR